MRRWFSVCRAQLTKWTGKRFKRGGPRELDVPLAEWSQHERTLAGVAADVERSFLALGADLQEQARSSRELWRDSERLATLAGGENGGDDPVRAATQLVEQTLAFIDQCSVQIEALVRRLERYHEQSGRLLQEEQKVERILAPLRIIQTLFRIEAATLPAEAQAGFGTVADEIPRFERAVRTTFEQHTAALAATREAILVTTKRLRERAALQQREAILKRDQIRTSLAELEREMVRGRERAARLAAIVREIDRDTGAIVVSLQYQDITRQKMEHVREALAELELKLKAPGEISPAQLELLHAACCVQAAQTGVASQEVGQAASQIQEGVENILRRLDQIERDCWPRREAGAEALIVETRVRTVRQMIADVRGLVPLTLESAADVIAVARSFGDVAADVAATASDMAESMRLIALNAQVLAAQAGEEGAGLLILAERTFAISKEIRQSTESIGAEFNAAAGDRQAVLTDGDALKRLADGQREMLDARVEPITQQLGRYHDEAAGLLGRLGEALESTHARLNAMRESLTFKDACVDRLAGLQRNLSALAAACEASPGFRAGSPGSTAAFAEQQRRYTMDSERVTHARAHSTTGESMKHETAPATAAGCDALPGPAAGDELGANVELF